LPVYPIGVKLRKEELENQVTELDFCEKIQVKPFISFSQEVKHVEYSTFEAHVKTLVYSRCRHLSAASRNARAHAVVFALSDAVGGKLGQMWTDFELKHRKSAAIIGILDFASGKTAPEAACGAFVLEIRP